MVNPEYSSSSDAELVKRYKDSGDQEVLGRLFTPYTGMLYGVCMKYLKDRDDAKDAVMQLFEKLITSLKQHEVDNFKSWLYVMARNHCLMQLRSRKGKINQDIADPVMENTLILHPEEEPELEEDLGKLENCIRELAGEQQACVRHFYLEEKCYKEIVALTGFDMNKVKSYIQNGKRNLKLCMERNG